MKCGAIVLLSLLFCHDTFDQERRLFSLEPGSVSIDNVTDDDFLVVSIECPTKNRNTIRTFSLNRLRQEERLDVSLRNGLPATVSIAAAEADNGFEEIFFIRSETTDAQERAIFDELAARSKVNAGSVCSAAGKPDYAEKIADNARILRFRWAAK